MSKLYKRIWAVARTLLAVGILGYLFLRINNDTVRVDFLLDPASPGPVEGQRYADASDAQRVFAVCGPAERPGWIRTIITSGSAAGLARTGSLRREGAGGGETSPVWKECDSGAFGLQFAISAMRKSMGHWLWWVAGFSILFIGALGGTWRWKLILQAQDIPLSWWRAFALCFIGYFFGSFMPGATGGDLVKAYYAARETGHKKAEMATSVFVDRGIGLLVLLVIVAGMMAFRMDYFMADHRTRVAVAVVIALTAAAFAALGLCLWHNLFERFAFFRRLEETTRVGPTVRRVYEAVYMCRHRPRLLLITSFISAYCHLGTVLSAYFFGRSVGAEATLTEFILLYPLVLAISAVPLTPGSLGLREGATVALLGVAGVSEVRSLALSLLSYAAALVWNAVGGVIFMFYTSGQQHAAPAPEDLDPERP